jgi:tetratricopeptide (TPR) repeat protein
VSFVNDLTFFYYQCVGDYKKGLEIAQQGLKENTELKNKELLGIYQSKRNIAIAHFYLKNYEEANTWFLEVLSMVTVGTRNWFNATSLYYLSLISQKDYDTLYALSIKILSNKNLNKFPYFEEQWKLREAYLHFLIRIGKIELPKEDKQVLKAFSLTKFLNSVPFHTKDKSGQNITILVIQILFLLLDNKYGQIIDRVDSLTQYTYRYLHKNETFRSNCFIKMLLLMVKADFHPIRTQNYTAELKKKLDSSHLITDEKSTQVEIIPYDYLWDLIIEILHEKHKK